MAPWQYCSSDVDSSPQLFIEPAESLEIYFYSVTMITSSITNPVIHESMQLLYSRHQTRKYLTVGVETATFRESGTANSVFVINSA